MRRFLLSATCLLMLAAARVEAASVTIAWDPNAEPDIAGYRLLYGTQSGQYSVSVDIGNRTEFTLPALPDGTYFFAVEAYNTSGLTSPTSAEVRADLGTTLVPVVTPAPAPTPSSSCVTADPFAAMGGGTCYNGGWLPPGMSIPGVSSVAPTPAPARVPAPAPSSFACASADPFAAMGGGTCYNGGWLPPGMSIPGGGSPSAPAPAPVSAPQSSGTCAGSDPFAAMGGGTCYNGGWLPPGMSVPAGASPSPASTGTPAPAPSSAAAESVDGCAGRDPFVGLTGLVGMCRNGGWIPVVGVTTTGTVRFFDEGFWGIAGDDGVTYVPLDDLDSALLEDGLRVAFKGALRSAAVSNYGATVIEILTITLVQQ